MPKMTNTYTIEDGASLEELKKIKAEKSNKTKYPWDRLAVGQSFYVDGQSNVYKLVSQARNRSKINEHGYKYEGIEDGNGVRVFRTQ